MTEELEKQLKS